MTDLARIKQYLPEPLWLIAEKFTIPHDFLEQDSDLVVLVLESKSLDTDEEKQNRFNLYPLMNNEQKAKLREILMREKEKLAEIEAKYADKKKELKNKYIQQWDMEAYHSTIDKIKSQENTQKQQEEAEAEALLTGL
ncbi:MAG: hypothetical protein NZL83_01295 [Candidatus Absconditabacterales bacterium]|nr:hypothetical protein [Candidatus Absconditabacterales bacterium]